MYLLFWLLLSRSDRDHFYLLSCPNAPHHHLFMMSHRKACFSSASLTVLPHAHSHFSLFSSFWVFSHYLVSVDGLSGFGKALIRVRSFYQEWRACGQRKGSELDKQNKNRGLMSIMPQGSLEECKYLILTVPQLHWRLLRLRWKLTGPKSLLISLPLPSFLICVH